MNISEKENSHSENQIPSTGIIFTIIALLSTLALATNLYMSLLQNDNLYQYKLNAVQQQVETSFEQTVSQLNTQFGLIIAHYKNMPTHINAMRENRRIDLYKYSINDYRHLRQTQPHLFVMHYFDTKNVTILRMHKPQSFGDDLTKIRPIVAHVNRTQIQASGFEPGKNGITYRITTPVFDSDNNHVGALEFGITLDYFVKQFANWFDLESQVLVKTETLKNLSYNTAFKQQGNFSIIYEDEVFKDNQIQADNENSIIHIGNKTYLLINNIMLDTFDNQPIVRFNLLSDITPFYERHNKQIQFEIFFNLIVLLLFLISLYWILNNYKKQVIHTIEKLKISEFKQQYFKESSEKDDLTGALNRRSWNLQLARFLRDKEPTEKTNSALLFFDIDHFKSVNDNYGHLLGDQVLQQLSAIVQHEFRANDHFYRWGGEEFCLLLEDVSLSQAEDKAEHLRETVIRSDWPEKIEITISLGVTQIKEYDNLKSLEERMDELMYQAKSAGRNCYVSDSTSNITSQDI